MKITQETSSDSLLESMDFRNYLSIKIDGKPAARFLDGEPEDANLSRDFNDCYSIVNLMKMAFDAGKAGETFEVEKVEVDDL